MVVDLMVFKTQIGLKFLVKKFTFHCNKTSYICVYTFPSKSLYSCEMSCYFTFILCFIFIYSLVCLLPGVIFT